MGRRLFMHTLKYRNPFHLLFGGVSEYVNLGDIADFERTVPFSVRSRFTTTATSGAIISRRGGSGAFKGWEVNNTSGQIGFNLSSNNVTSNRIVVRTNAATFSDGTEYDAVVTYDGSSLASGIKIYIDGQPEAVTASIDNLTASISIAVDANLGGRNNGENLWIGTLDEPAIYNKELSAAEVLAIYNKGKSRSLRSLASGANLVGWLQFTQDDITNFPTIEDFSGNNNDGTAIGMVSGDIQPN